MLGHFFEAQQLLHMVVWEMKKQRFTGQMPYPIS